MKIETDITKSDILGFIVYLVLLVGFCHALLMANYAFNLVDDMSRLACLHADAGQPLRFNETHLTCTYAHIPLKSWNASFFYEPNATGFYVEPKDLPRGVSDEWEKDRLYI